MKKRVLSGIRATGRLHLGNYLGAIKGMIELANSDEYETLYMVADLHTITTPYSIDELRKNRREIILDYLAVGLDPEKSILFEQSESYHAELAFYLSSVVNVAKMQHLPTFKDKVKQHPDNVTMALLNYPILMAADILLYKASLVPVGIDQEPHLEIAREIARKMNNIYQTDFLEPTRFATKGEYVPSLTGEGKMSKSVEGSYINISDDLETIVAKVAKIPTDNGKGKIIKNKIAKYNEDYINKYISENNKEALGVAVLMEFVELFEGDRKRKTYEDKYVRESLRYGEIKKELSLAIFNELKPIQEKRRKFEANPELVDEIIKSGSEKARAIAQKTLLDVKQKMGLL